METMEVWEGEQVLFRRTAGTPAPLLLTAAVERKGPGELSYPADSSDAGTGVAHTDVPPYPNGKYCWTSFNAGRILSYS